MKNGRKLRIEVTLRKFVESVKKLAPHHA